MTGRTTGGLPTLDQPLHLEHTYYKVTPGDRTHSNNMNVRLVRLVKYLSLVVMVYLVFLHGKEESGNTSSGLYTRNFHFYIDAVAT